MASPKPIGLEGTPGAGSAQRKRRTSTNLTASAGAGATPLRPGTPGTPAAATGGGAADATSPAPTPPIPNIPPRGSVSGATGGGGTASAGASGFTARSLSSSPQVGLGSARSPFDRFSTSVSGTGARARRASQTTRATAEGGGADELGRKLEPYAQQQQAQAQSHRASALTASLGTSPSTAAGASEADRSGSVRRKSSGMGLRSPSGQSSPSAAAAAAAAAAGGRSSPSAGGAGTPSYAAGESAFSAIGDIPDEEKAKVLRRHLVSAAERSTTPGGGQPSPGNVSPTDEHGDYGFQGGSAAGQAGESNALSTGSNDARAATPGSGAASASGSTTRPEDAGEEDHFPIPYDALGGDVTHDLYKWSQSHGARPGHARSASFSHVPLDRSAILDPTLAHIKEPGGFRRNFVVNRAVERGEEPPTLVRNVVDFLYLYGHFAGEDLEDDDDDDDEDDEDEEEDDEDGDEVHGHAGPSRGYNTLSQAENGGAYARSPLSREIMHAPITRGVGGGASGQAGERQPLLGQGVAPGDGARSMSRTRPGKGGHSKNRMYSHRRTRSGPGGGTATMTQAVLMLLKGFVGTGILFMGKAFFNGGLLFSTVVMLSIAGISLWSFLLLCKAYLVVPGSFGDIGGQLYGNYMRLTILFSIAVSQIGFVAAYTIFIAENLQAFIMAVTDCRTYIPTRYLIFAQLVVFMPLAMIRNLAKLSGTALVADAFILIGILYIGGNEISVLSHRGIADVQLFNRDSFPLLIGTAVFAFEGIGLVIPITESMKEPHKFPRALTGVMFVVSILFAAAGFLGYAAYGKDIQTVVIVNLPQEAKFVQAVQFLYSVAILLSTPLQLFPAVRIMENGLFSRSGKHNPSVKWQKNVFRAATVVFCSLLSWAGSSELDKFVALVGSFACIPLCFIYPPLLHLRACANTRTAKALDILLLTFGILVGIYTTVQTVGSLFQPGDGPPKFGKCEVPAGF